MVQQGSLIRAYGRGEKVFSNTAAITGTGAITLPNGTAVDDAVVSVVNTSTVLPTDHASITSISSLTINIVVTNAAATVNAVATAAKNVSVIATFH